MIRGEGGSGCGESSGQEGEGIVDEWEVSEPVDDRDMSGSKAPCNTANEGVLEDLEPLGQSFLASPPGWGCVEEDGADSADVYTFSQGRGETFRVSFDEREHAQFFGRGFHYISDVGVKVEGPVEGYSQPLHLHDSVEVENVRGKGILGWIGDE